MWWQRAPGPSEPLLETPLHRRQRLGFQTSNRKTEKKSFSPSKTFQGLKCLDFSGYNKIYPVVAHLEANFGDFWPFQDPWGAPGDPKSILYSLYVYFQWLITYFMPAEA
jgi:hypothetical protein